MSTASVRGRITRVPLGFQVSRERSDDRTVRQAATQIRMLAILERVHEAGHAAPSPLQARSRRRVEHVLDTAAHLVDELGPEAITTAIDRERRRRLDRLAVRLLPESRVDVRRGCRQRSLEKVTPIAEAVHKARCPTPTGAKRSALWSTPCSTSTEAEPGFRVLWFSRFQSAAMVEATASSTWPASVGAYERMQPARSRACGSRSPSDAMHLVIGIIDKGLDLAFLIDPDGDHQVVDQTVTAVVAYLERYAVTVERRAGHRSRQHSLQGVGDRDRRRRARLGADTSTADLRRRRACRTGRRGGVELHAVSVPSGARRCRPSVKRRSSFDLRHQPVVVDRPRRRRWLSRLLRSTCGSTGAANR